VHYLQQAGENALWRSAYRQAENYLTQSLALLQSLPDTPERARHELAGQLMLSRALMLTRGHGAPEVEDVLVRARTLGQWVGDTAAHFRVQRGLWTVSLIRADLHQAHEFSNELLHLAHQQQDADLLANAHAAIGTTSLYRGDFPAARAHVEKSLACYDLRQPQDVDARYEFPNRQVYNNVYLSKTLWILGYPQQALASLDAARHLAQELVHPFNLAIVLDFATELHQLRGEVEAVQTQSEALLALAQAQDLRQWVAWAQTMQGWVLAMQGRRTAGITQMWEGMAAWRAAGDELDRPRLLGLLADLCRRDGQAAEGLHVLSEALALMDTTAERWYEAELYRLKGELLLHAAGSGRRADCAPEACFQQALAIARSQQAKSWELRAATSLARHWQSQGKRQDAYALLAPVYEWFTEGCDTADVQEAKVLLHACGE
jgi:predicted ATPase